MFHHPCCATQKRKGPQVKCLRPFSVLRNLIQTNASNSLRARRNATASGAPKHGCAHNQSGAVSGSEYSWFDHAEAQYCCQAVLHLLRNLDSEKQTDTYQCNTQHQTTNGNPVRKENDTLWPWLASLDSNERQIDQSENNQQQ